MSFTNPTNSKSSTNLYDNCIIEVAKTTGVNVNVVYKTLVMYYRNTPASNRQFYQLFNDSRYKSGADIIINFVKTGKLSGAEQRFFGSFMQRLNFALSNDFDDDKMYNYLRTFFASIPGGYLNPHRAARRSEDIAALAQEIRIPTKAYLDLGCSEGSITENIAVTFGFKKENVFGADIVKVGNPTFNFIHLQDENGDLPFKSQQFSLVSCVMSLHHFKNIKNSLSEIHRVLDRIGFLIIREHDCGDNATATALDIVHGFYSQVYPKQKESETFLTHYAHYRSKEEMIKLIEQHGFKCLKFTASYGNFKQYYAIFQRI